MRNAPSGTFHSVFYCDSALLTCSVSGAGCDDGSGSADSSRCDNDILWFESIGNDLFFATNEKVYFVTPLAYDFSIVELPDSGVAVDKPFVLMDYDGDNLNDFISISGCYVDNPDYPTLEPDTPYIHSVDYNDCINPYVYELSVWRNTLFGDLKTMDINGVLFSIAQLEIIGVDDLLAERRYELEAILDNIHQQENADYTFVNMKDLDTGVSKILCHNQKTADFFADIPNAKWDGLLCMSPELTLRKQLTSWIKEKMLQLI